MVSAIASVLPARARSMLLVVTAILLAPSIANALPFRSRSLPGASPAREPAAQTAASRGTSFRRPAYSPNAGFARFVPAPPVGWMTDPANSLFCQFTGGGPSQVLSIDDRSKVLGSRQNSLMLDASPGATYRLNFTARLRSGAGPSIGIVFLDSSDQVVGSGAVGPNLDVWTGYNVTLVAPASAVRLQVQIRSGVLAEGAAELKAISLGRL